MKRLLPLLFLAGCGSSPHFEPGDVLPDYFELHGGATGSDISHPRPLFNEIDATGYYFGATLGWNLTAPSSDAVSLMHRRDLELLFQRSLDAADERFKAAAELRKQTLETLKRIDSRGASEVAGANEADNTTERPVSPENALERAFHALLDRMGPTAAALMSILGAGTLLVMAFLVVWRKWLLPPSQE